MLRNFLKEHKIPDKNAPSDSNDQPSNVSHAPAESANEEEVVGEEESMTSVNSMRCHEMRDQYHVVPGSSWGNLSSLLPYFLPNSLTQVHYRWGCRKSGVSWSVTLL